MATSVKQLLEAANAVVPKVTPAQAREMMAKGNTLVVDVRDAPELEKSGKVAGAVHHSRGMLEFRADPSRPTTTRVSPGTRPSSSIALPAVALRSLGRCSKIWAMAKCTIWALSRIGPTAAVRLKSRSTWACRDSSHWLLPRRVRQNCPVESSRFCCGA